MLSEYVVLSGLISWTSYWLRDTFSRWSLIAGRLPGRTDNEIKNYWNTHIRRKLVARGIDPATHRPLHAPPVSDATITFARTEEKSSSSSEESMPRHCLDLNLELCISPPSIRGQAEESVKREEGLCFDCRLGLRSSTGCKCSGLLGLSTGVLDFRSFLMKWKKRPMLSVVFSFGERYF